MLITIERHKMFEMPSIPWEIGSNFTEEQVVLVVIGDRCRHRRKMNDWQGVEEKMVIPRISYSANTAITKFATNFTRLL